MAPLVAALALTSTPALAADEPSTDTTPIVVRVDGGFSWTDAGIGVVAGAGVALRRRRRCSPPALLDGAPSGTRKGAAMNKRQLLVGLLIVIAEHSDGHAKCTVHDRRRERVSWGSSNPPGA